MGEFDIAVEDIFANGQLHQDVCLTHNIVRLGLVTDREQPKWYTLKSRRKGGKKESEVSGDVQIQFSLIDSANLAASPEEIYLKFMSTIQAADADSEESISRVPSHDRDADGDDDNDAELDDGAVEESGKEDDTSDETEDQLKPELGLSDKKKKKKKLKMLRRKSRAIRAYEFTGKDSDVSGLIFLEIGKIIDLPPEKNSKLIEFAEYRNDLT